MTHESLFILALAGLSLWALAALIDRNMTRKAKHLHTLAKRRGALIRGYAKAEMMVQHKDLTMNQRCHVDTYIDLLEMNHDALGLGHTSRFARLRQTLIRNSHGLRVVV